MLRFDFGAVVAEFDGEPALIESLGGYLGRFVSGAPSELRVLLEMTASPGDPALPESEIEVRRPAGAPIGTLELLHRHIEARYDPRTATLQVLVAPIPAPRFRYFFQLMVRAFLAEWLIDHDGFALHAASVVRDGAAYLFVGPSGAGKSTVVRNFSARRALNDDFSVVRRCGGRFLAAGTPIHTRDDFELVPERATICAVLRLFQAPNLRVHWHSAAEFFPLLVPHVHCFSADAGAYERVLATCAALISQVRCAALEFTLIDDIWREIHAGHP